MITVVPTAMPDQMKAAMLAPWTKGDFGALARHFGIPEAEDFIARLELIPGARVLDLACGTGNATIPLARRGASVTGLDRTPHLLEQARARATCERLQICFDEGVAETLPYSDAEFDTVTSMFGIMFSPAPDRVASEMARVLKPAGRLALANWTRSGFGGKMSALVGRYLPPPPPGTLSPMLWGDEKTVQTRLGPYCDAVQTRVVTVSWELSKSPVASAEFFARKCRTNPIGA